MKSFTVPGWILMLFATAIYLGCGKGVSPERGEFPDLKGAYLGQIPPGETARLFAPGIVSTGMDDRDIAISPDGKEIFFGVMENPHYCLIWLKEENGRWQPPKIPPFSGKYNDYEPQFSPDGKKLFFCSERPLSGDGEPKDADIWVVERKGDGWGEPGNLGSPVNTDKNEFYPSPARNGNLYFTSHTMKICRARYRDGKYLPPEVLPDPVNTRAEYNAFIDPEERFLIFTSHSWGHQAGRGDLFISFRDASDGWGKPLHLGPAVNSGAIEMSPTVSPDGRYLFFSSMRTADGYSSVPVTSYGQLMAASRKPQNKKMDIYWVDAGILKNIRENRQPGEKADSANPEGE